MVSSCFATAHALRAWHTLGMRVCHLGNAAVVVAIVGTLAIFLLPLPHATAPYPATHGPVTFPRSSRMVTIICMARIVLLIVAILTSALFFSVRASVLLGLIVAYFASSNDRMSLENSCLRC
jgi:hypothetical protein